VEAKLEVARQLLSQGKTATRAAETVGWSRVTLYRYLKQRAPRPGGAGPAGNARPVKVPVRAQQAAAGSGATSDRDGISRSSCQCDAWLRVSGERGPTSIQYPGAAER
jgi:transposase-like protein